MNLRRFQLEGTVQVKEQMTSEASERITELQTKFRISEDEISNIISALPATN